MLFDCVIQHYSGSGRQLIGALNAGSNVTGVLTDTDAFSALLHKYGALAFWDYAAAGTNYRSRFFNLRIYSTNILLDNVFHFPFHSYM